MKKDILNRKDIIYLVDAFYEKVKSDNTLSPFFDVDTKFDWKNHLKVMYDFWDNVLFYVGEYDGNPMATHNKLHNLKLLKADHFKLWIVLFKKTVDENYKGKNATAIKLKAISIATIMQTKLFN